jgi:hypothetical protein
MGKNVHYDDDKLQHWLADAAYPVVKLKKLECFTQYGPSTIEHDRSPPLPDDFDREEYCRIHPDISIEGATQHFLRFGRQEGRKYKKDQPTLVPKYLEKYAVNLNVGLE